MEKFLKQKSGKIKSIRMTYTVIDRDIENVKSKTRQENQG